VGPWDDQAKLQAAAESPKPPAKSPKSSSKAELPVTDVSRLHGDEGSAGAGAVQALASCCACAAALALSGWGGAAAEGAGAVAWAQLVALRLGGEVRAVALALVARALLLGSAPHVT
jgi:hypothetical protein